MTHGGWGGLKWAKKVSHIIWMALYKNLPDCQNLGSSILVPSPDLLGPRWGCVSRCRRCRWSRSWRRSRRRWRIRPRSSCTSIPTIWRSNFESSYDLPAKWLKKKNDRCQFHQCLHAPFSYEFFWCQKLQSCVKS